MWENNLCDLYGQVSFSPRYNLAKVSTLILACPPQLPLPQKKWKEGRKEERREREKKETYLNGTWTKMRRSNDTECPATQPFNTVLRMKDPSKRLEILPLDGQQLHRLRGSCWMWLNLLHPYLFLLQISEWTEAESKISARIAAMSMEIMSVCVHISLIRIQVHHTWQAVIGHEDIWAPVSIHLLKAEQNFLFLDENNTK